MQRISYRRLQGGHDVQPAKILSRYAKSISNGAIAIKLVDRAYVYDNSVDEQAPVLVFRSENGRLKKVYRQPLNEWARPLYEAIAHK